MQNRDHNKLKRPRGFSHGMRPTVEVSPSKSAAIDEILSRFPELGRLQRREWSSAGSNCARQAEQTASDHSPSCRAVGRQGIEQRDTCEDPARSQELVKPQLNSTARAGERRNDVEALAEIVRA